jgi:hypothetical protein
VSLLRSVERYLKVQKIPASRFGREATGDPRLVFDLRKGREPRAVTIARIEAFMERKNPTCAR